MNAKLVAGGAVMGIAGDPVQVRNHDAAGIQAQAAAVLRSDLPIAGFTLIEADDLRHAIELASASPCAVAREVIEVWPLQG